MASGLPPPPVNDKPGSFAWLEWYRQLRNYVSTSGSVPWYIINFSGSNITDIVSRSHENLQGIQGGTAGEHQHLTNAEHTALSGSTTGTWTPTFNSLTEVLGGGTINKAGRYQRHGNVIFYQITIVCTGAATTACTAGTSYCDLPVGAGQDDVCLVGNRTTKVGIGTGVLDATNDRIYPTAWTATGNSIVITGKYEV